MKRGSSELDEPGAVAAQVEAFLLSLPLGSGRAAAEVEAAAELSRGQLKQRLKSW